MLFRSPQNPKCDDCIFRRNCAAFHQNRVDLLPVKMKKQKIKKRYFYYFLIRIGEKILMRERSAKDIWRGLFDFPLLETKRNVAAGNILMHEFPHDSVSHISKNYKHILTHQLIHARFIEINWTPDKGLPSAPFFAKATLCSLKQIQKVPKPRLISRYLEDRAIL